MLKVGLAYQFIILIAFVKIFSRAILENADVIAKTTWTHLLYNDYWGTPIVHSGSHKSYRPLCVATFRLNYVIHHLQPFGFHLVNILLHIMVTLVFYQFTERLLASIDQHHGVPSLTSNGSDIDSKSLSVTGKEAHDRNQATTWTVYAARIAAILFATHPIHTEAVTGLVGRADVGCCLFYLLSLLYYIDYCNQISYHQINSSSSSRYIKYNGKNSNLSRRYSQPNYHGSSWPLFLCLVFTVCAMLMKEQGITVLGVCLIYDIMILHRRTILSILVHHHDDWKKHLKLLYPLLVRATILAIVGSIMMAIRWYVMGATIPSFSSSDNPAAHCDDRMTRILTFNHLLAFNAYLLVYPNHLNFDWSMNAIPLIQSIYDIRNIATLLFYAVLIVLLSINVKYMRLSFLRSNIDAKTNQDHFQCNGHGHDR